MSLSAPLCHCSMLLQRLKSTGCEPRPTPPSKNTFQAYSRGPASQSSFGCVQNVLLDGTPERPLLKICDFGYSKNEYLDSRPKSLSGTPDYIAPEVRRGI